MTLVPEVAQLLTRLRDADKGNVPPFCAPPHWRDNTVFFDRWFTEMGIGNVPSQPYNLMFAGFTDFDHRLGWYARYLNRRKQDMGETLKEWFVRSYAEAIMDRDVLNIRTNVPVVGDAIRFGEYEISIDQLLSIDDFYNLYELNPAIATEPLVIGDLGGGWGRLGHALLNINPCLTYVDFDIPESLLVAIVAMRLTMPRWLTNKFPDSNGIILDHLRLCASSLWFLPSQDLLRVEHGTFDMMVNTFSFQEMPRSYVALYLNLMDAKTREGGAVYLRQGWKRDGGSAPEIEGYAEYDFPKRWKQKFLRNATFSDMFFETGFTL